MWVLLQATGCVFLAIALAYMRNYGLCLNTWLFYIFVTVCITSWVFPLSYKSAPSFLQVYFLGVSLLTLLGVTGSVFYFGEKLSIIKYLGVLLISVGACCLF